MITGLFDKNGKSIHTGDKTRLVLEDGEVREFDVCLKTVERTVKCHPDFDDEYSKVAITGIVFCWNGYDLFPCIDENGVSDVLKMEVIQEPVWGVSGM
nr:MAG TPA: YopX protein [Bacteriophage sp.]